MYIDDDKSDAIIDACQAGKESGYKAMYLQYYAFGKSICTRHSKKVEDVEEILSDVFMKVFKNINRFEKHKPFKAWFRTIAVNTCIDFYRANNQLQFSTTELDFQIVCEKENVLDNYGYQELLILIQKLPTTFRMVFLLFVVEGYSHKEIAEKLNINEITSRTSLNKARAELQKMILAKS